MTMWSVMVFRQSRCDVYVDAATPEEARERAAALADDFVTTERVSAYEIKKTPDERWFNAAASEWIYPPTGLFEENQT